MKFRPRTKSNVFIHFILLHGQKFLRVFEKINCRVQIQYRVRIYFSTFYYVENEDSCSKQTSLQNPVWHQQKSI